MNTPINARTSSEDKLKTIEPTSLKNLLDKQEVVLIDVRELGEHKREKIPGSIQVSLSNFDPKQIPTAEGKQLVLHCQTSNRSAQAAQKLFAAGYSEVTHLHGGLNAWKAAGYKTTIDHDENAACQAT